MTGLKRGFKVTNLHLPLYSGDVLLGNGNILWTAVLLFQLQRLLIMSLRLKYEIHAFKVNSHLDRVAKPSVGI